MPVVGSQRPKTLARCTSSDSQIGPCPGAHVLVFDTLGAPGTRQAGWGCLRTRAWMLVFSSVESTNSSARRRLPSQRLAYRSRMRPALSANCGSRGKIQVRCCQGRMASSCNQRHTVVSLTRATNPHRCASRTISAQLSRDSGSPRGAGSSQARALICTTSSGGKNPGAARAWALFQAR